LASATGATVVIAPLKVLTGECGHTEGRALATLELADAALLNIDDGLDTVGNKQDYRRLGANEAALADVDLGDDAVKRSLDRGVAQLGLGQFQCCFRLFNRSARHGQIGFRVWVPGQGEF